MNLPNKIARLLRTPKFEGEIVSVNQIYTSGKDNLHNQTLKLHHGYDESGMPITETVEEGVFDVTLENSAGARKTYRTGVCIEPKIGTRQSYRVR